MLVTKIVGNEKLLVGLTLIATLCMSNGVVGEELHSYVQRQTPEEAKIEDISLIAKQSNLNYDEVEMAVNFQHQMLKLAEKLNNKFPDKVSGFWFEPVPKRVVHIRFVGKVPTSVSEMTRSKLYKGLKVHGGDTLPLHVQLDRVKTLSKAIVALGYKHAITMFNQKNQLLETSVQISSNDNVLTKGELIDASNMLTHSAVKVGEDDDTAMIKGANIFNEKDIAFSINYGEKPIISFEHSRGGNWLRDDGFRECTSGWAVHGTNGDGIVTAAHCNGLNQFEQPGISPYSMQWRRQHLGPKGDVEYHTTSHYEPAEFYATQSSIREVHNGMHQFWFSTGMPVCRYGRSSNIRTCNHTIQSVGISVNLNGTIVGSLVSASNHSGIPGDSGGGWSFNNTAYGIHSGSIYSGTTSIYTPIFPAMSAVGTTLKTQ